MKKLIIAASILISSSAMATVGAIPLSFSVDNSGEGVETCTIDSTYNENASLAFYDDGGFEGSHYARIYLTSNLIEKITANVSSNWTETAAWGGVDPKATIYMDIRNRFDQEYLEFDNLSFEAQTIVNSAINVETDYAFKVRSEKPTHQGSGNLEMIVQIDCE